MNGDGLADLVCPFDATRMGFEEGDTEGILRGKLTDSTAIEGIDVVRIMK